MHAHEEPEQERAPAFVSIRLSNEDKLLIARAAERRGVQLSSFFILLLVHYGILPKSRLAKVKRRLVVNFRGLHLLLGIVNKVAGNCKQVAGHLPEAEGLKEARTSLAMAAGAITDCLKGKPVPDVEQLIQLTHLLSMHGHALNDLVRLLNIHKRPVPGLTERLVLIRVTAGAIANALYGSGEGTTASETPTENIRATMRKAAQEITQRNHH